MENAAFRDLLSKGAEEKAEKKQLSKAERAEAEAKKRAAAKAAHDRRAAAQKKREERIAEQNRYRDRAADRRIEEQKQVKENGEGEAEPPPGWMEQQNDPFGQGLGAPAVEESDLPAGPTFAQLGDSGRGDLSQQQHRLTIAQSKYLGGDIEHTHLVKGLDYALLQKRRAELSAPPPSAAEEGKKKGKGGAGGGAGGGGAPASDAPPRQRQASQPTKRPLPAAVGEGGMVGAGSGIAGGAASAIPPEKGGADWATGVLRIALEGCTVAARPNRALQSGRLMLVWPLGAGELDVPSAVVRAEDDLSIPAKKEGLTSATAGVTPALHAALQKTFGRGKIERQRKHKRDKGLPGDAPALIHMKPLPERRVESQPNAGSAAGGGGGASAAARGRACARDEASEAGGAHASKAPPPKAAPVIEDDLDMFGDAGSDYVCVPNEAQVTTTPHTSPPTSPPASPPTSAFYPPTPLPRRRQRRTRNGSSPPCSQRKRAQGAHSSMRRKRRTNPVAAARATLPIDSSPTRSKRAGSGRKTPSMAWRMRRRRRRLRRRRCWRRARRSRSIRRAPRPRARVNTPKLPPHPTSYPPRPSPPLSLPYHFPPRLSSLTYPPLPPNLFPPSPVPALPPS